MSKVYEIDLCHNGYHSINCVNANTPEEVPSKVLEDPTLLQKIVTQYCIIKYGGYFKFDDADKKNAFEYLSDLNNLTNFFESHNLYILYNHSFMDYTMRSFELYCLAGSSQVSLQDYLLPADFESRLDYGFKGADWKRERDFLTQKAFQIVKHLNLPTGLSFGYFYDAFKINFKTLDFMEHQPGSRINMNHKSDNADREKISNLLGRDSKHSELYLTRDPKVVIDIIAPAINVIHRAINRQ